jgi:integrase
MEVKKYSCSWLKFKVMDHTGLRLGEALAMRLEYFDPERWAYTECQSFKRRTFKKPKGGKIRVVDLLDYLVEELIDYVRYLKKEGLKTGRGGRWTSYLKIRRSREVRLH